MTAFNLKDFSLLKEDGENYTIGHPHGKSMQVPKRGLSNKAQELISKLKREQHLAHSKEPVGMEDPELPDLEISPEPSFNPSSQSNLPPLEIEPVGAQSQSNLPPLEIEPVINSQSQSQTEPEVEPELSTFDKAAKSLKEPQNQLSEAANKLRRIEAPEIESLIEVHEKNKLRDKQFEDEYKKLPQIDQGRYWDKKSTGSKVASIIGIVLGGIGQGLIGGPNYALTMLNDAIAEDIEAQKNNQSRTWNLWKMHREASGDDLKANILAFNNGLSIAKLDAEKAQNLAQNAMQKANLAQFILGIDQQKDQLTKMNSLMQFNQQSGLSDEDPALLVPQLVTNDADRAKVYKEIQAAENRKQMASSIMQAFDQSVEELKAGEGILRTAPSILALHQALMPTFSEIDNSVGQAKIDKTFEETTPTNLDLLSPDRIEKKRESLQNYLKSNESAPVSRSYKMDLNKFRRTAPDSSEGHYRPGTVVEIKGTGKRYQIGQDGNTLTEVK